MRESKLNSSIPTDIPVQNYYPVSARLEETLRRRVLRRRRRRQMAKQSVGELKAADLKGKKVFVWVDLNVPLDEAQRVTDDTHILAAVPTLKYLINHGTLSSSAATWDVQKLMLSKVAPASAIPVGWMGLDIGPDSITAFSESLDSLKTIIWNEPMGVFEFEKFAVGTRAIAKKLGDLSGRGATTIIGGGDSVAVVEKAGLADDMSHISTGGGASLELLEGKSLPGVLALDDAAAAAL